METIFNDYNAQNTQQFKSYYVVWKLFAFSLFMAQLYSLNRTMQYGNELQIDRNPLKLCRLNRTMQYGNFYLNDAPEYQISGLNRTMQYGNLLVLFATAYFVSGLNRTMQYGNRVNLNLQKSTGLWFKSYYVVWKPVKVHIGASLVGRLNRTMQYGNTKRTRRGTRTQRV